jgi:hypothetical protein
MEAMRATRRAPGGASIDKMRGNIAFELMDAIVIHALAISAR